METRKCAKRPSSKQKEPVMSNKYPAYVGLAVVLFVSLGCTQAMLAPTPLDKNWGRAVEVAKDSQALNPDASQNLDPVTGLDGQAAENDIVKYRKAHAAKQGSGDAGMRVLLGTLGSSSSQK
jgi:hypothetical protein